MTDKTNIIVDSDGLEYLVPQLLYSTTYKSSYTPIKPDINTKAKWGQIKGDITNQTDLWEILQNMEEEISHITPSGDVFRYKGQVDKVADLPSNAEVGDVYDVIESGANYVWNGTNWDKLSENIDLSEYAKIEDVYTKAEISTLLDAKADLDIIYTREDLDTILAGKASVDELNVVAGQLQIEAQARQQADSGLDGRLDTLEAKDTVEYTDISTPENPNRKAIVFKNHDGVFGKDTDGNTRNIAMISKYNVADFGTSHLHTNLNTQQIVTVNDNQAVLTDKNFDNILKAGDNVIIDEELVTDPTTGFQFKTFTVNAELSGTSTRIDELAEDVADEIQDRIEADAALQDQITALVEKTEAIFHYKGSVATEADLPTENNQVGDVWNVTQTGSNYAWTGTVWDKLSETIDLSAYDTIADRQAAVNELQENIDTIQSTVDDAISHQDGNIQTLVLEMEELAKKIEDLKSLDYEAVSFYDGGETQYDNPIKDFQLSGHITSPAIITSNSVTLKEATQTGTYADFYADQDITLKTCTFAGSVPKATSNAILRLRANGYVTVRDYYMSIEKAYNAIECNLTEALSKSIIIDNVDFDGPLSNNAINVFGMATGGVVTIANCHFKKVSNLLRLSNRTNTVWTVNIINCVCDEWDVGDYGGAILLQDYTSKSAAEVEARNEFHNLTINIQNLTKPDGTKLEPCDLATICGTKDANQIIYLYDSFHGVRAYDPDIYPTINIQ